MDHRTCRDCGVFLTKKPGPGRWPTRCAPCRDVARKMQQKKTRKDHRSGKHRVLGVRRCGWCNEPFGWYAGKTKFCSTVCAGKFNQTTGKSCAVPWGQCEDCLQWYVRRGNRLHCPRATGQPLRTISCPWCGRTCKQASINQRYCSQQCKAAVNTTKKKSFNRIWVRNCPWCETTFVARMDHQVHCSRDCGKQRDKHKSGKFWISDNVRYSIYSRDRWLCQLCMEPVDPSLAGTWDDWAPSLDHVVCRSWTEQPDNSPGNLRLAHRWCNSVRGNESYHTLDVLTA